MIEAEMLRMAAEAAQLRDKLNEVHRKMTVAGIKVEVNVLELSTFGAPNAPVLETAYLVKLATC